MPGMGELIVILLIVLVVFGASKLPQIGDALGRSIKNFKRATKGDEEDEKASEIEEPKESTRPAQLAAKPQQKQLEPASDDDGEWEEVVVRRRKKSASSSES
jgi:sec-independent protein translocase protein TatA